MFRTNPSREFQPETVNIEDLVPQDHLLRKINETIDFSFIAEKCRPLYCQDNGRPCIDPVMLFKMLLIGYLYGIRSERRLIEEIRVNIAYRWFVGLSLTDPYLITPFSAKTAGGGFNSLKFIRRSSMKSYFKPCNMVSSKGSNCSPIPRF